MEPGRSSAACADATVRPTHPSPRITGKITVAQRGRAIFPTTANYAGRVIRIRTRAADANGMTYEELRRDNETLTYQLVEARVIIEAQATYLVDMERRMRGEPRITLYAVAQADSA